MKKIVSLLMVMVMVVTLFTGCTPDEKEYYNIAKEMGKIGIIEGTTKIDINVDELFTYIEKQAKDSSITAEQAKYIAIAKEMLKQKQLELYMRYDKDNLELYFETYLVDKTTKVKDMVTTIIYKSDKLYINIEQLLDFAAKYELAKKETILNEKANGIKYISIDMATEVDSKIMTKFKNQMAKSEKLNQVIYRLIDELANKAMSDFSTEKLKKIGTNKFQISMTGTEVANIVLNLGEHFINNAPKYGDTLTTFLDSLTDNEFALLGEVGITREEFVTTAKTQIASAVESIKTDKNTAMDGIIAMRAALQLSQVKPFIESIKISETFEKTNGNEYNDTLDFSMDLASYIYYLSNQGGNARATADKENIREINNAVQRYEWDNGNFSIEDEPNIIQTLVEDGYLSFTPTNPYNTGEYKVSLIKNGTMTVMPDNTALYETENNEVKSQNVDSCKVSIKVTSNMKSLKTANIVAPTEGLVNVKDLENYAKHELKVNIDDGSYNEYVAKIPNNSSASKVIAHNMNVRVITNAIQRYEWDNNDQVDSIQKLITKGYLSQIPLNPLGTGDYTVILVDGKSKVMPESADNDLDIKIINDSSYLPARKVVEILGDEINWDAAIKKAYITVNGKNVYLEGIIINNRTYIKVRELEKVGYKIDWNEETREVGIEK
ncbi:MAG TPA: hypothetical protein DEP72_07680 [Clostridiales bacterium]|nr:MAG: hypothetical protein A2Y18_06950 [Clostridiales bacterium GWD2_32_19]HCC08016.1 hypothetical protein [Clostridiales bacterium]